MGFNKRHINKNYIIQAYANSGINGIKSMFSSDALFLADDFSHDIHSLIINGKFIELSNKIKYETNEKRRSKS